MIRQEPLRDPPEGGWRDDPIPEPEACGACHGWGASEQWARIPDPNCADGHRLLPKGLKTCRSCRGTGRRRPAPA